jgi:hypothetical protein
MAHYSDCLRNLNSDRSWLVANVELPCWILDPSRASLPLNLDTFARALAPRESRQAFVRLPPNELTSTFRMRLRRNGDSVLAAELRR